ncbi:MAG: hypothetical protein ABI824_16625 [Acidobacteriota bacterium]
MALANPVFSQAAQPTQVVEESSSALQSAIQEFRVQTGKLGIAGGSDTSEVTRAGASPVAPPKSVALAWHGRVYENLRNDFLDAIPHEIVQRGGEQRKLRRNQYGFSISGPVVLPKVYNGAGKTFFTLSYEGMRESLGQSRLNSIPTTLERTGDWSQVVDFAGNPLPIYDPHSTAPNPLYDPSRDVSLTNLQYNRQQFLGNKIPTTQLDPASLAALQYYPQPNASAGPFFRNNYFVVSPQVNRANGFIFNIDHSFLKKHRISTRASRSVGVNGNPAIFPTIADPQDPSQDNRSRSLTVEHVFTASPTNVNNLRFFADEQVYANQQSSGTPFPRYDISGYQSLGRWYPISSTTWHSFQLTDTFATRWRKHRLSIGTELTQYQVNSDQVRFPEGHFQFTAGLTSLPGINNTGHGFASFLLGDASFAEKSIVISPSYFRWGSYRAIFSDQWQITPSLTLSFGLNSETFTPRTEKYDRQSNISFSAVNPQNGVPGILAAANSGGFGRSFSPVYRKVEPNAGIAWSVLGHNSTVVRADYQRRYGQYNRTGQPFGTQAFNGTLTRLSANSQLDPAAVLVNGFQNTQQFPDLRPDAANGTSPDYFDTSKRQPTRQAWGASLQQQITSNLVVTIRYDHDYGRDQFVGTNAVQPNSIPLSALQYRDQLNDLAFNNSVRPFPQYQDFNVNSAPGGRDKSNSLNLQVEKRSSGGLAMSFNYSYASRYDDYSAGVQDYYNLKREWSRSAWYNPHYASLTFLYELPFGAGKPLLRFSDWRRHIVAGWAISGSSEFFTGSFLVLNPLFNNTGGVVRGLRVNTVPGVSAAVANQSPGLWFNPAAFAQPDNFTVGNAPRTSDVRGPGGYNHDMTINKRFAVDSARTLEFVASLFNATNHANWNWPDTTIGPASSPNVNAGKIIGSNGGRIVQLGLRLNF